MLNNHGTINWNIEQLHNGCILAGIAHAIMAAHYPVVANEHSWDGINYSMQNNAGSRGTVTFHKKYCVGGFYNGRTKRATQDGFMEAHAYLWNAPLEVLEIAETETFQYLLDYMGDEAIPVITAAFWGDLNGFYTNDTYEDFLEYGGHLLNYQALDYEQAIAKWVEEYNMASPQLELLKSIYRRKTAAPNEDIILSKDEIAMIGSSNPEGLDESQTSFEELNIYWAD